MLTLNLTLDNGQVTVRANELQSHAFSIRDLDNADLKNFVNDPKPYGGKLFEALFKDDSKARKAFDELSKQAERTIVLVLESIELDGIAWEYAYHDNAYVVEDFAFIRALPEKVRPHSNGGMSKSIERVPLLFIPANPLVDLSGEPMRELDIESEWRKVKQFVEESNAPFDLIELRPATPAALQSMMARFQNGMIAHFSGHGAATKDGAFLLFENENGSSNPLEAREFVREVKDKAWIGFLSACESAVAERTEFGNLARELVRAGVPFALGMQFNLPDPFAPNISGQFYNYLSQGHAVPEAARQARRAVKRENEFYVGMIALYAAHPDEAGKMGWTGSGARTLSNFAEADVSDLPTPSGFIGRQGELMNIGTSLLGKKKPNTVTLHGAGGIGKTALMRQALLRFAPSFESALAIALDPLPSLESMLGRLERFLNLPSPCSNDTKEREQIVREKLTGRETLLGLDNFETLIHARDNGSDEEKKTAKSLYSFFKSLAAEGVTLCVTSREKTSLPGEIIQEIHGLEDEVGGRLFQNTVSTRRDALNEVGLEKISAAVGGHPLALRLLAPIFEEQAGLTLDDFVQKLETFLPNAHDEWTEQGRHESLGACFSFSMDNLPKTKEGKNLQIALARLSVFTTFFAPMFAYMVISNKLLEAEYGIKSQLENAEIIAHSLWERGLLERTAIEFEDGNFYLYRLHPVISSFAKEHLPKNENDSNLQNYLFSMQAFTQIAQPELLKSSLFTQLTFMFLPDLQRASLMLNGDTGANFAIAVADLLRHFGILDRILEFARNGLRLAEENNLPQIQLLALTIIADTYRERDDLDGAMDLYKRSLEIIESLDDHPNKAATLYGMARIYFTRNDFENAVRLFQQAIVIWEGAGENRSLAVAKGELAVIYVAQGELEKGLNLQNEKLEIIREIGDLREESIVLNRIAQINLERNDVDGAVKLLQRSLEICEELSFFPNLASTLHQLADIYFLRQKDLVGSVNLYERELNIEQQLGDAIGQQEALNRIAEIYTQRGNLDMATRTYQQALEIDTGRRNLERRSQILGNIAKIYDRRGDLESALRYYQENFELSEKMGALDFKASSLHSIASILRRRGDLDGAMKLGQEALELNERLGDLGGKGHTLHNLGIVSKLRGDLDGAMKLFEQALEIAEKLKDLKGKSSTILAMANIYRMRGDSDNAMEFYQQSLKFAKELNDPEAESGALLMVGQLMLIKKEYAKGISNIIECFQISQSLGMRSIVENAMKILTNIRKEIGIDEFSQLWKRSTNQPLPDWLSQSPRQSKDMAAKQFIVGAIQSAREKRPEAEKYFKEAQEMAIDFNAPAELRSLGKVLQRIMIGEKNVDLSALTSELREMVEKALEG